MPAYSDYLKLDFNLWFKKWCPALILLGSMVCTAPCIAVEFTASQKAIIKSLTLTPKQLQTKQKKAEPANQYSQNLQAKKLGKALFFDTRLSGNGAISCASCHNFSTGLADNKTLAQGLGRGTRNTPTLINAFIQRWFFWDGRADSLWLQALGPIESNVEMGGNWQAIYALFINDKKLFNAYNQVFITTPINKEIAFNNSDKNRFKSNIGKAIAAFEIDIVQFNSRFDTFANNIDKKTINTNASVNLTKEEQLGLKLFVGKAKCVTCHFGPNFSDGEFHNIRLISQLKTPNDSGRYGAITSLMNNPMNILGDYSDIAIDDETSKAKTRYLTLPNTSHSTLWAAYKTPTLRNISQTAPYMHDGSLRHLKQVIEHYSTFKGAAPNTHMKNSGLLQPLNLTVKEQEQLLSFLQTLTGKVNIPTYD